MRSTSVIHSVHLRPVMWGVVNVTALSFLAWFAVERGINSWAERDATMAYWSAWEGGLYDRPWLDPLAFVYSPAFAQAFWPLSHLPFDLVAVVWAGVLTAALAWLVGPISAAVLAAMPHSIPAVYTVWFNVSSGNIALLLAVAVVLTLQRWPAAGAFLLLTKVTPGVALLWFAVRREWRALGIALVATAAVVAVSAAIAPHLWAEWFGLLVANANSPTLHPDMPRLTIRGPVAAGLIALAAWRSWPWLVPIGVMIALPQVGVSSLVLLLAIPRLAGWRRVRRLAPPRLRPDAP